MSSLLELFRHDQPPAGCWACVPGTPTSPAMCDPCVAWVRAVAWAQAQPGYRPADKPRRNQFGPIGQLRGERSERDAPGGVALQWS